MGRYSMSTELINRNPDLQRLQHDGYEVEVRNGYLILHSVPYVNPQCKIALGTLVTDLTLNNDQTQCPTDHQVWFIGSPPCNQDGSAIAAIGARVTNQVLCEGLSVQYRFSCKPQGGYPDYYSKMTRYVEIMSNPARAIDSKATACTFKPIKDTKAESIFTYTDSASSRAGIAGLAKRTAMNKIAVVGLGGTGSYILDLVVKTHVKEIHLFDGDEFLQHNAFRAPGAASFETLGNKPSKVDYYTEIYSKMRRGLYAHEEYISTETVSKLAPFDFVFLSVDRGSVRKLISDFLREKKIPFIDVGMSVELVEELQCLRGTCRITLCTPDKFDHFPNHVSLSENRIDDLYDTNIQVVELNAFNATMAVIKWKKYCGFYHDCHREHQSAYVINTHQLTRDETIGMNLI